MRGSSAAWGFWKMSCIVVRNRRNSSPCSDDRSRPAMVTVPLSGRRSRSRIRASVLFPQPDSPTRPMISPRRIVKLTPSTERTLPRRHAPTRHRKVLHDPVGDHEVRRGPGDIADRPLLFRAGSSRSTLARRDRPAPDAAAVELCLERGLPTPAPLLHRVPRRGRAPRRSSGSRGSRSRTPRPDFRPAAAKRPRSSPAAGSSRPAPACTGASVARGSASSTPAPRFVPRT